MFGAVRASFIFVARHPLSWALAAAKWACVWERMERGEGMERGAKAPPLRCLERLVEVWLRTHEKMNSMLPLLRNARILQAFPPLLCTPWLACRHATFW